MKADRWSLTVAALLGEPLPELPAVPAERCRRHVAPVPDGIDRKLQSYARACSLLSPGWRGWRP